MVIKLGVWNRKLDRYKFELYMERWAEIYEKHPEFQKAMTIEENNKHMPRQKLAPRNYTLRDMEKQLVAKRKLPIIDVDSPCGSECMI